MTDNCTYYDIHFVNPNGETVKIRTPHRNMVNWWLEQFKTLGGGTNWEVYKHEHGDEGHNFQQVTQEFEVK